MKNLFKNRYFNKYLPLYMIIVAVIVLLGTSYALLRSSQQGTNAYTMNVGLLEVNFYGTTNTLTMNNLYPMTDEEGISREDNILNFTIQNNENNIVASYDIYIEETSTNPELKNVIRYAVNKADAGYGEAKGIENNMLYIDKEETIEPDTTINYKVKFWLSETAGNTYMNKTFTAKVVIISRQQLSHSTFIKSLKDNGATYIAAYNGESNDTYNEVGHQPIYYFTGANAKANSNVLFAGYCWQMIRTTDTGGVKLLYNGVAENNQCLTTRNASGTMKGINGQGDQTIDGLNNTSTYGTGFTYDENGFTLTGVLTDKTWSTDNDELIGMYTCLDNNLSCSRIYQIGRFMTNSTARGAYYDIGPIDDKYTIGKSPFNGESRVPSSVGYMYNKQYRWKDDATTSSTYANDVTYSNGIYTLVGTVSGNNPDTTHHYVCENAECSIVRFYFSYYENSYRYILLEKGEKIEDALYNMLNYKTTQTNDTNLNVYNSSMKAYLESWYANNLVDYSSYIDMSTTYCNDRKVIDVGSWDKNGEMENWWTIKFNNYNAGRTDLKCPNEIDNFSVKNNKAKLVYPIGLIVEPERALMSGAAGDGVANNNAWSFSPYIFYFYDALERYVSDSGSNDSTGVHNTIGVRPVIALSNTTLFSEGNGSYASPYVVGEKIARTIS